MFKVASRYNETIKKLRKFKTIDIVERVGVITADRIFLENHPISNPVTAFNPGIAILNEKIKLYVRIVLGYFTYASAVAEITLPIETLDKISRLHHNAKIIVYPENRYDIWGVEDPRVYVVDNKLLMTYCGRTVNYFNPIVRVERTVPVTAIYNGRWRKLCVFRAPENIRKHVVSDKDAFLVKLRSLMLFHRVHTNAEMYCLTVSRIKEDVPKLRGFKEIIVEGTQILFESPKFEYKIGWGTPPIQVESNRYLLFLHGVDREFQCYRVFAILINKDAEVTAVTPYYIMEPKENYEKYGDRPFTIFPCGAIMLDDDIILSYGGGDSVVALGKIDVSEIMSVLDMGRLE